MTKPPPKAVDRPPSHIPAQQPPGSPEPDQWRRHRHEQQMLDHVDRQQVRIARCQRRRHGDPDRQEAKNGTGDAPRANRHDYFLALPGESGEEPSTRSRAA
jgi:hypothetical protein